MTFVDEAFLHRGYDPSAPALFFSDWQSEPVSYLELDRLTRRVIGRLDEWGLKRGDVVALDFADEFLHAILLVSCARTGIVTLSGTAEAVSRFVKVASEIRDKPRPQPEAMPSPAHLIDASWLLQGKSDDRHFQEIPPDDLCRIMLTSGTTGEPKGVALTYGMVAERLNSYRYAFGSDFPNHARLLCGMRLSSSLGFAFLFYTLARGGFFCSDSVDFEKMAHAIEAYNIKLLITTPFTLSEILSYEGATGKDLGKLSLVLSAGSLVSPELAHRVRGILSDRFVIFYGTTETGVIASSCDPEDAKTVGYVVPGRRVEIVGTSGQTAPPDEIGRIRISASAGPLPYFELSELSERRPRSSFEPADIGKFDQQGRLIVLGREDRVINVGGTKTTPETLEQTIQAAPGIADCGVVPQVDDLGIQRIVALLVLKPGFNQQAFQAFCEANIIRDFLPSKFVVVKQLPRNLNGKIDRPALSNLVD
jgi:acyl-coenzyme A synthetase/AMP-(fatty) acid ligase